MCNENDVIFDIKNQRVHCFAHIINLAAQDALKALKGTGPESEEEVLNDKNPVGVIAKVIFFKLLQFLIFIFIQSYLNLSIVLCIKCYS